MAVAEQWREIPKYLAEPEREGVHLYGVVSHDMKKGEFVITAEPAVMELAKRVFPGCDSGRRVEGQIRFAATRRAAGDLNWLLLRFPMKIECEGVFARERAAAIDHARRRERGHAPAPLGPVPGFKGELRPFQAEGVSFLLANERALLADDMGLGKTVMALAAMAAAGNWPALVVGPTNVMRQWGRMAETFLSVRTPGEMIEAPARCVTLKGLTGYEPEPAAIYLIHYGLLRGWRRQLVEMGIKTVVFDEAQELRHTGTEKYSAASVLAQWARNVWLLSGTPIYNYGAEIWSVLNVAEYHCLGDKDSFSREWCRGYGSEIVAKPAVLGDYLRREGLMLRRSKGEVMDQLPPKRRVVSVIDHDEQRYGELVREAATLAASYGEEMSWHERGLTKRKIEAESRKATGVAKAPWAAAFARALVEAGERVLVFAYHHDVHDVLTEALAEFGVVKVTGRETPAQKDAAVNAFAAGEAKVIVLSLRTAAGLDGLQGAGTCVVFAELDWSPAIHAQCEDRLQRMGVAALESILCYYLVAQTAIDEAMQEALGLKVGQFVGLMGEAGESEADRALAQAAAERHMDRVIEALKGKKASTKCTK